jgi:geranylgeranyl pyrophosphate synthase
LDSFSNHIGLAYQIQDDVLDVITSDEVLGKRQNSDSEKNKPSYPSILGLDESVKKYESLYQMALDEIAILSVDEKPLKDLTFKLMKRSF